MYVLYVFVMLELDTCSFLDRSWWMMYTVADRLSPNVLLLSQFPSSSPASMQNNALVQAWGGKNKLELSARCPGAGDDEHHGHNDDDEQGQQWPWWWSWAPLPWWWWAGAAWPWIQPWEWEQSQIGITLKRQLKGPNTVLLLTSEPLLYKPSDGSPTTFHSQSTKSKV